MIGFHRTDCGCAYCLRPVVTQVLDSGPGKGPSMSDAVERDLNEVLSGVPKDWYGGREVTQKPLDWYDDCKHEHTTKYASGKYCRDCGHWL